MVEKELEIFKNTGILIFKWQSIHKTKNPLDEGERGELKS